MAIYFCWNLKKEQKESKMKQELTITNTGQKN